MPPLTLIITAGTAPAVITEMLYVIYTQHMGNLKTIKVITTQTGKEKAIKDLLLADFSSKTFGAFYDLASELELNPTAIPLNENSFYVPTDSNGRPLNDIRNREDDLAFATLTNKIVRDATADPTTTVIACQAGGRKTMGSHLLSAMQVYGRKQDKVYHILVNEPYESCPDFYFPTKTSKICTHFKDKSIQADAKDAAIDLVDIPFLRLRHYLEEALGDVDFNEDFDVVLSGIERYLNQQLDVKVKRLFLDVPSRTVYVNKRVLNKGFQVPPKPFALLLFSAYLLKYYSKYEKVTFDLFQDEKVGLDLRVLWHMMYYSMTAKHLEDDTFFDIEFYDEADELKKWSKNKSDLKKKLTEGLSLTEIETPIQDIDIWINNTSESSKANKTPSWLTVSKERVSLTNFDISGLSRYIEHDLRVEAIESIHKKRSRKESIFNQYEAETIHNKFVSCLHELEKNVGQ